MVTASSKNPTMKRLNDIHLKQRDRAAINEAIRLLKDRFPVERIALYPNLPREEIDRQISEERAGWGD